MFDTMTLTKVVGGLCGSLLIFLLGKWAAETIYHTGGGHGDDHHAAYVIDTGEGDDHSAVTSGHYHVYLDADDDAADHVTAFTESVQFALPADIAPGTHELRVSLRAPDHHGLGIEDRVTIQVQ